MHPVVVILIIIAAFFIIVYIVIPAILIVIGIGATIGGSVSIYNYAKSFKNNVKLERSSL